MRALRFVLLVTGLALCTCAAAGRGAESAGTSAGTSAGAGALADKQDTLSSDGLLARIFHMFQSAEHGDGELAQDTDDSKQSKHHHNRHLHYLHQHKQQQKKKKKTKSGEQILEIFPRDLRKKEKFLKHLTGPLNFSPKCRKHVYRLYHSTRDCNTPAYYRRCARLLARLAGSPRCIES